MGNKCPLNRDGLGAKHLTDDVVQSSPLPPSLHCCNGVKSCFADAPLPCCTGGDQVCSPPISSTAALGNPSAAAPVLRSALGDGVCGAPSVLHEQGGGGALCSSAADECHRGGRRAGLPLQHPFSRRFLPRSARLPPHPKGVTETNGGPQGSPQGEAGGGRERQAPPPPPFSKDILFFLPRTKDNKKRGGTGTYPAKSSP